MSQSQPPPVQLTLLSTILGADFPLALERQRDLGLWWLDLKDGLWGKSVEQLDEDESFRAARLISDFGLNVHCFSTSIGHTPLEATTTEAEFRARHEPALENVLRVAEIVHPQVIRLLAPRLSPEPGATAMERLLREFPWTMGIYREWIDRIAGACYGILIENEAAGCLLRSVADILAFFAALGRPVARYTWDVQNLWQSGTFPSLEAYRELRPLIGALHLKGGRAGQDGRTLKWAAPLDEASWPVVEIVRAVIADAAIRTLCLNPSHGEKPQGWDVWEVAQRDAAFLRSEFPEIARAGNT